MLSGAGVECDDAFPILGYRYSEGTVVAIIGVGDRDGSVRELKMCCGWEAGEPVV